jgi:hypothetical protein
MKFVIALSALNLAVASTLLAVVIIGGRKAMAEIKAMKNKANNSLRGIKSVLEELES